MSELNQNEFERKRKPGSVLVIGNYILTVDQNMVQAIHDDLKPHIIESTVQDIAIIRFLQQLNPLLITADQDKIDFQTQEKINGLGLLGVDDPELLISEAIHELGSLTSAELVEKTTKYII